MKPTYHSVFTPSNSDLKTLERLFVGREDLVHGILSGIRESAQSENKHYRLLVGPRGIGKTHLVALVYHRVRQDQDLDEELRVAWLPEDPYFAGYPTFLLAVLEQLGKEYGLAAMERRLDEIRDLKKAQEVALERLLLETLGEKTLLLVMENLGDLMNKLRGAGQHRFRAFLQNHRKITILATSTSLVDALEDREKAFYGFFRITKLEPFRIDQAVQQLARLADRAQDTALAAAIRGPMGLARVRAVHYLAGGNPRIYALFYDFLSREALDELTHPLLKLIDELTAYYQGRMSLLAPLQQQILNVLRQLRGASTVTEIARQALSSSQSISSQLGKLIDLGYVVQVDSVGRWNYYELREPLMRLVLEAKEQRGQPIALLVQFLRVWYSEPELDRMVGEGGDALEAAHLYEAARRAKSEPDPLLASLTNEFFNYQSAGQYVEALAAAEVAIHRAPGNKENWIRKAACLAALERGFDEQFSCWKAVTEIDPQDGLAWNSQALLLGEQARYEDALAAEHRSIELLPENPILNRNYSIFLKLAGRDGEARTYREKAVSLSGEAKTAVDWDQKGQDLWVLERRDEALVAFRKALELDPHRIDVWHRLLGALQEDGRLRLLHIMALRLVALLPDEATLYSYLGTAHADMGRPKEALAAYETALKLDPELDKKGEPASFYRALMLHAVGRTSESLHALEHCEWGDSGRMRFRLHLAHARTQMWLGRWEESRSELDNLLERDKPPLWTGRDLGSFGSLLAEGLKPEFQRLYIKTILDSFGRAGRLAELGQALVRSLRNLPLPWVTAQTAQVWYRAWQELAGEMAEMAIPLRLLGAGVDYFVDRDPRALLRLAREERGLLEPWLMNLFEENASEIDGEMEALLATVERRLADEATAGLIRAFWEAPPPDLETLDFARLLKGYGTRTTARLSPLMPGLWKKLSRSLAERLLRQSTHDEQGARAWSRPNLRIIAIARRPLDFSDWFLYQVDFEEDGRSGALDLMASEKQAVVLDGRSQTVHALVENGTIRLEIGKARSDYTRFFSSVVRGEMSRFQVVDELADLEVAAGREVPAELRIHPWEAVETPTPKAGPTFSGTILYSNALFRAKLRLTSAERGFVDMTEDEPLVADLEARTEIFDGPLRFLAPLLEETA